ncbi:DDE-domain-containing protein [Lepidopterella palustris CBS 459.81]|uniref:DDE-domain-containing protein n=1 Tax=Lepidopterella palustris CBS 459.81 TaxID=1314670 RepID=A0A8E2DYZ5_9PEZI|nr:DDE-domain-containing protein [Lepidopterella palustris CBS 459.81]
MAPRTRTTFDAGQGQKPTAFCKRHPELKAKRVKAKRVKAKRVKAKRVKAKRVKAKRVKALDWNRHDKNIYDKVRHWFDIIGPELDRADVLPENMYNMDETGVMLSMLGSLKVLVGKDDLRMYRGAGVKRTMVTAIEWISADAATHRSTWATHPTPGWHFACSLVFDPQTRSRANSRPRILICDGFGTYESLEILTYCLENNIILCRIPSHTSHKLQPCDVSVFAALKAAYREQVEKLYRGGANTVGKQHFTLLYSRAREQAFTSRSIKSGWSKTGLYPFSPHRVLKDIQKPIAELRVPNGTGATTDAEIDRDTPLLNAPNRHRLRKLANAARKCFAERALLLDENRLLFEQNNESNCRKSVRPTEVGEIKVMSYADSVEAQSKRDAKEGAVREGKREGKRGAKRKGCAPAETLAKRARKCEVEMAVDEIETMGLREYCSVPDFKHCMGSINEL